MPVTIHTLILAVSMVASPAGAAPWSTDDPASAQARVSPADIERLQGRVYEVSDAIADLRGRDGERARRLQAELDEQREEVIYLKVMLRKVGSVPRSEYSELRDRLEDLRMRAAGGAVRREQPPPPPREEPPPVPDLGPRTVPVDSELDVRLQSTLDSGTAEVEDRFEATTVVDLSKDDEVLIPAGSIMRGLVTSVDRAGRTDRTGSLTIRFDRLTVGGRSYPIRGTVTELLESAGMRGEVAKIGTGAGVGAIIGGILGGFKGALAGILIGAGGTILATEGEDVNLPPGTIVRVRLDTAVTID